MAAVGQPIRVNAPCGRAYAFKPEYAGSLLQCPCCRKIFRLPASEGENESPLQRYLRRKQVTDLEEVGGSKTPLWRRAFEFRQEFWALDERYEIREEGSATMLSFAERDLRYVNAALFLTATVALFSAAVALPEREVTWIALGFVLVSLIALRFKFFRRDVIFWSTADRLKAEFIVKDLRRMEFPRAEFQVEDGLGAVIGRLSKPWIGDVLRSPWSICDGVGNLVFRVREESLVLSLLSRLFFTKLWWFRTNFILVDPATDETMGEFRRRWLIADHYVLDMRANHREVDIRLLWALGVLLDSAERR